MNLIKYRPLLARLVAIALSALLAAPVQALNTDSDLPIEITSDRATINDATGLATYSGNVVIFQGATRLEADTVSVTVIDQALQTIVATGSPARFQEGQVESTSRTEGQADTILYNASEMTLQFQGNAKLRQPNNSFAGEQILYDINARAIRAKGDDANRVKIQYRPASSDKTIQTGPADSTPQTETTNLTPDAQAIPADESASETAASPAEQKPAAPPESETAPAIPDTVPQQE